MYVVMYNWRMARMVRKQVYITADQERLLKQRALNADRSESDLLREGLDSVLRPEDEKKRLEAWQRVKRFMDQRALIKVPQTGRSWTREELYDERPKYLSR